MIKELYILLNISIHNTLLNETQFQISDHFNLKKYTMSSIITGILSSTVGLLWNKARDTTAAKLQDGDVTDAKIRDLVVREMTEIKTTLKALTRQDLNSSYSFLRQGLIFLNAALDKSNLEQKALPNKTQDDGGESPTMSSTVGSDVLNEVLKLSHAVEKIKLMSDGKFELANERFKDAQRKATEASSIDTLSIEDKIFAAKLQILSQIMECLDNPENAIIGCLPVLQNLHALPAIQDIFNVYINGGIRSLTSKAERVENVKSVMLINYVLYQYVFKFSSKNPVLQCWPTIELADRSFYPILQWAEIALGKSMGKELDQHPGRVALDEGIFPHTTAVNSHSEVIVEAYNTSIKIISRNGEAKTVELSNPKEFDNVTEHTVEAVAVDQNDKVYVLRWLRTETEHDNAISYALSILDENYNVIHTCLLDFLKIRYVSKIKMVINKNNNIIITKIDDPNVYICDELGQLKHKFEATTFQHEPTLAISEKNEIIRSCWFSQDFKIYTEEGNLKSTINLPEDHKVVNVAFHHVLCKILVLTKKPDNSYFLLIYSQSGELETTTLVSEYIGSEFYISLKSHPSGPVVVVAMKSITFI